MTKNKLSMRKQKQIEICKCRITRTTKKLLDKCNDRQVLLEHVVDYNLIKENTKLISDLINFIKIFE